MEDFIEGLLGVVIESVYAYICEVIATTLPLASLLYSITNIVATIATIHKMQKWVIGYLIGWLAGSFLLFQAGLLNILDIIFPLFFLFLKIIKLIFG